MRTAALVLAFLAAGFVMAIQLRHLGGRASLLDPEVRRGLLEPLDGTDKTLASGAAILLVAAAALGLASR